MVMPATKDRSTNASDDGEQDQQAMTALANGNDQALNEIIDRWQKPITSFLYRTIGDYQTSLDLSQEVFIRLYKNKHRFKPNKRFSSYIFTIAANLAKNHFRWKGRHPEAELNETTAEIEPNHNDDPSICIEKREKQSAVRSAVLGLPEKLRIPVILFYYEDMSHAEIAEVMSTSSKTIETRMYRARQLLKSRLTP